MDERQELVVLADWLSSLPSALQHRILTAISDSYEVPWDLIDVIYADYLRNG